MSLVDKSWTTRAPKIGHVAAFDGIRGIGVFGVMIGHSYAQELLSYAAIVDIFFVISGFLITSLLLQEHSRLKRIDLKKFYARRSLRLVPLLYALLAIVGAAGVAAKMAGLLDGTQFSMSQLAKETVTSALYVHNIFYPTLTGPWYAHLWTLSVEEQFYLVVGVFMVVSLARGWIKPVVFLLGGGVALVQITRLFGITGGLGLLPFAVWIQRPDSLMVGMLIALFNAHLPEPLTDRQKKIMSIGAWIAAFVVIASVWASTDLARRFGVNVPFVPGDGLPLDERQQVLDGIAAQGGWRLHLDETYWFQWGFTVANWAMGIVILAAFRLREWWPNKALSWAPMVWIGGRLSYGLYLWHYPVQHFLRILIGHEPGNETRLPMNPVFQLLLDVSVPFLFAVPTYYLVELKALDLKNRFQPESAPVAAAAETSEFTGPDGPP